MIKVVGGGSIVDMEAPDSPDSPGVVDSTAAMSLTSCARCGYARLCHE